MKYCILLPLLIIQIVNSRNQHQFSHNNIKESPFYIVTEQKYLIVPISIGSPVKLMNLVIDINSDYTWLSENLFSQNQSDSYKALNDHIDITQDDFSYNGVLSIDQLSILNMKIDQFHFGLIKEIKNNPHYLGVISFSSAKGNGLIDQLHFNHHIAIKSFSIKYTNPYEGIIAFGNTIDVIQKSRSVSKCISGNGGKWLCELNYISFDEIQMDKSNRRVLNIKGNKNILEVNQMASFETIYDKINVPKDYFDYIKERVFYFASNSNNTSNSKCYSELSHEGVNELLCPRGLHETIPKVTFIFNGQALVTDPQSMFHCKNDICKYHIVHTESNDQWKLGYHFMKHFDIFFDQNNKAIYFTSDSNNYSIYFSSFNSNVIKKCGYLILILLMIGISLLIFVMFINSKNHIKKKNQLNYYS